MLPTTDTQQRLSQTCACGGGGGGCKGVSGRYRFSESHFDPLTLMAQRYPAVACY